MLEFKDLECNPAASTLYQEEIDILMEVVEIVLECAGAEGAKGAFILDGQPNDGEAGCILRFNLFAGRDVSSAVFHCLCRKCGIMEI